jgi:hypothetical protein
VLEETKDPLRIEQEIEIEEEDLSANVL